MTTDESITRFVADLTKWETKLRDRIDYLVRRVALRVAENVIVGGAYGPGTPVRTGFARASWWASIGDTSRTASAPTQTPGAKHGAYEDGLGAALTVLAGATAGGGTIYLLNDASYIRSLEYGHSQQAPAGMVRVVVALAQTIVDAEATAMATA